ncbi:hypothetical protein [Spirosoma sordidisoli]|uniref:Uncharacterized protein n=1 Tax=Spirosoma sordidisoli TaxID=2502893 RepID=A0A4Q2UMB1_9BACT|nr:hypothetical protein [Spirosoma sordidisoli]RYC68690.1 hypothetical protein EQG79_20315 [Spirosoma sordidisoli]
MNQFKPLRLYGLVVLLVLGVFTWATITGTRLLGDDDESVEKRQGYSSGGRSGGRVGRTHFYHK